MTHCLKWVRNKKEITQMATKYLLQIYFYLQKTHTNTFLLLQSVLPDLLPSSMKGPNERTDTIRKVNKVKAVITIITVILSWFHLIPCTTCMVHSEWSNKKKIFPRHPPPQKIVNARGQRETAWWAAAEEDHIRCHSCQLRGYFSRVTWQVINLKS